MPAAGYAFNITALIIGTHTPGIYISTRRSSDAGIMHVVIALQTAHSAIETVGQYQARNTIIPLCWRNPVGISVFQPGLRYGDLQRGTRQITTYLNALHGVEISAVMVVPVADFLFRRGG